MKTVDWNDVKLGTVVDLDPLSKPVEVLIMGSIGLARVRVKVVVSTTASICISREWVHVVSCLCWYDLVQLSVAACVLRVFIVYLLFIYLLYLFIYLLSILGRTNFTMQSTCWCLLRLRRSECSQNRFHCMLNILCCFFLSYLFS